MDTIHLTAPAGSCAKFYSALGVSGAASFIDLVDAAAGDDFRVAGSLAVLDARENDRLAGRSDDELRARDLMEALADDNVVALITVRGGAWLTRLLPKLDLRVLQRRRRPVTVFGFSEITTLVNLVAKAPMGRGVLDMGPAFIPYGLRRFDPAFRPVAGGEAEISPERVRAELADYVKDVVSMLRGRGTRRRPPVTVISGTPPAEPVRGFVGGNLAVFTTLLTRADAFGVLDPATGSVSDDPGREAARPWLVLEDINEPAYRIDRFLAHLTLAGVWSRIGGLVLGNFHQEQEDLLEAVRALLPYHLGRDSRLPVVVCPAVGHVWPMSPLPLNRPARFIRGRGDWEIVFDWETVLR